MTCQTTRKLRRGYERANETTACGSQVLYKAFTQPDGELWTHDCVTGSARKPTPEKTAFETNIYTPVGEYGARFDLIENTLAMIESRAASIYPDLLAFKHLEPVAKFVFAAFLATMFAKSRSASTIRSNHGPDGVVGR